jgi:MFS family permease
MGGNARWAITAVFATNGLLVASIAARAPSVKVDLGLSAGQLGLVTAAFGVAAVAAMQCAGALAARFGSRRVVRVAVALLPLALFGTGLAGGLLSLAAAFLLVGTVHGVLDVTQNAHAVAVERGLGRPILNGCHAAWSIGAVGGSLLASGAAQLGLSRAVHFGVLAVVLTPIAALWTGALLPAGADQAAATGNTAPRVRWSRPLMVLGAMGATVLTVEAAVANWSGIFLHERLAAPLGLAAVGYVAFTACQTAGRLFGDRLLARRAPHELLRAGVLVAAAGLVLVVVSPWPGLAIAGFAVVGIGLAAPLPVLFGAAGHLGGTKAAATVARFSTMTYAGILLAPAIIGAVADLVGLTWTLAALAPLLAAVAAADLRVLTAGQMPAAAAATRSTARDIAV